MTGEPVEDAPRPAMNGDEELDAPQRLAGIARGGAPQSLRLRSVLTDPTWYMLIAMLVVGGGGEMGPVLQASAEWLGIALLAIAAVRVRWSALYSADRAMAWLLICSVLLIVGQLWNLPADVWSDLGGRTLFARGDILMMGRVLDRPLSLDPDQTMATAMFALPALGVWLRARTDRSAATWMISAYLMFLALSLALALVQAIAGPDQFHLYHNVSSNLPTGLFSNRNHQAIAMAVGIPLAAALDRRMRDRAAHESSRAAPRPPLLFAITAIAATMGALLTGSRTGCALLVPALAAGVWIAGIGRHGLLQRSRFLALALLVGLGLLVIVTAAVLVLQPGGALALLLSRSSIANDDRYAFWPVVVRMIGTYLPWGAGLGTFRRLFEVHEPTELLAPLIFNHAHNDWLEWLVETGVPGALLALGFIAWLVWRLRAVLRHGGNPVDRAAGTVIILLLAHSVVDYPLRGVALSACFAGCVGLLSRRRPVHAANTPVPPPRLRLERLSLVRIILVAPFALAAAAEAGAVQIGAIADITGDSDIAMRMPYARERAFSLRAWQMAASGARTGRVANMAVHANAFTTLDEPAFAAAARVLASRPEGGAVLKQALDLSRRDPWTLQAGFARAHASADSARELDLVIAMIRQNFTTAPVRDTFIADLARAQLYALTVDSMLRHPGWRVGLLSRMTAADAAQPSMVALIGALRRGGVPLSGDEFANLVAPLAYGRTANPALAYRLWQAWIGDRDPWDWPAPDASGTQLMFSWTPGEGARTSDEAGGRTLRFAGRDSLGAPVASRTFYLPAGQYRFVAKAGEGLTDSAISAILTCDGTTSDLSNGQLWQTTHACNQAELRMLAASAAGTIGHAALLPQPGPPITDSRARPPGQSVSTP